MNRSMTFWLAGLLSATLLSAAEVTLDSPDGQIKLKVMVERHVALKVL